MLNRLREKFQRFMIGRYGMDQLGQFMVSAVLVVIVVNLFVRAALPSMILNMLERRDADTVFSNVLAAARKYVFHGDMAR